MDSNNLLIDVAPEKTFYLFNGKPIKNLSELVSELENMSQTDFSNHCNKDKDDFATWINDALGLSELALILKDIIEKDKYVKKIKSALNPQITPPVLPLIKKEETKSINQKIVNPPNTRKITLKSEKRNGKKKETTAVSKKTKALKRVAKTPKKMPPKKREDKIKKNKHPRSKTKNSKSKLTDYINQTIQSAYSKEKNALNEELNKIMLLNGNLNKKLNLALNNRTMQIEKAAQQSISNSLKDHLASINSKVDKLVEQRISKLEQSFGKKTEVISSASLNKFRKDIINEKHNLHVIASEAMRKEFDKIFHDDEKLNQIVSKYQRIFSEEAENIEKLQKDNEIKFATELSSIKSQAMNDAQIELSRKLSDIIKKQREILDNELAKTLSSNKFFYTRYEKEAINREKLFQESAEKQLKDNFAKHEDMLASKYDKYYHDLLDLKVQLDKDFMQREAQLNKQINSKITEELNQEFGDILINQRNQLSENVNAMRESALSRINTEFDELLSKQKKVVMEQSTKVSSEHQLLKEKFIIELKSEQGNILSSVKDLMKKELAVTIKNQRELLDKELEKTVLANKYFVERFEKEIADMSKKLTDSGNKLFEENYAKHKKLLQEAHDKQLETVKKLISTAGADFFKKESEIYSNVTSTILSSVREAVNKEFGSLIMNERKALEAEISKAEENNRSIEKKFEDTLHEKAQELIKTISDDANTRFSELVSVQQTRLNEELLRAKKSYEFIENKKNSIIEETNSLLGNINTYSSNKLRDLEREHNKHLKKVSQLSELITKTKDALNDLKEMKAELNNDKKNVSKENEDYTHLISELTSLRDNLAKEKNWISLYRAKVNIYLLMRKCDEYVKLKDATNAKLIYNKIAEMYARTPFEKNDKAELYNAALALSKEIQAIVSTPLDNPS